MSVIPNPEPSSLKSDISDFIQLLQKQSTNHRRLSLDSDKLSIIYSASEPQSSQLISNKENQHQSANTTSHHNSQTKSQFQVHSINQFSQIDMIVLDFATINPTPEMARLVERIKNAKNGLMKSFGFIQAKYRTLEAQFEEQKSGTDEILKALVKMDQAQKQLWKTYSQLSNRYQTLEQSYQALSTSHKTVVAEKKEIECQLTESNKNIQFMRKLVLIANQNYENLQKKCISLQRCMSGMETFKEQRSSPQIVSRSTIINSNHQVNENRNRNGYENGKKSSCSPSISQRSAKGSCFEQNYRKLVLRTLKSKALR